jgi:high-affinity iron transporter
VAYLRAAAPFASDASGTMSMAFAQLQAGMRAYHDGDHDAARRAFISAYLDGVEPHEAGLRARDAALVNELEAAMLALRSDAAAGVSESQLTAAVEHARELLARAEHGHADANAALIGALTISLREGVEIVLLVAALLGLVRKRGQPELARYVHAGWLLAIPAGLVTYFAAESVLSGMRRELAEGVASLVAAVVLLGVTHWLLGQLGSKHWVGFLAKRMGAAVSGGRAALGVLSLSFIAAYREAFEIVLFFEALVRDAGNVHAVWIGASIGLAILVVLAFVVLKLGSRLRPAPFMLASSVCLAVLCFMLLGKGIRALQEAGVVPMSQLPLPSLPWLGFYPTYQTAIAQGVLVLALIASAVLPKLGQRRHGGHDDSGRAAPAE